MPRPGGEADKLGNQFEAVWTVDAVLDVFLGRYFSISVEPFGDESEGIEFYLESHAGTLQFHSVKRQKQGGDWSIAKLCEIKPSTGRSILGDLFAKRQNNENVELCFVSATGANQLRELHERAETPTSLKDFRQAIGSSTTLTKDFDNYLVPLMQNDEEKAFHALKSLEVVLISQRELVRRVEQRIETLFYRKDRMPLEPEGVRSSLERFVLENLGPPIAREKIDAHLDSQGYGVRDWKVDREINDALAALNSQYHRIAETELINSAQIPREESGQILNVLNKPDSCGALLVGPGGYGKSCVLAQCLSGLEEQAIPHLMLRMDAVRACQTTRQLGEQLDLPASPAIVLAGVADNSPCVLVVDQLDATSLVSGRQPQLWEVFQQLCDEMRSYPNMKMVLACRDFDLEHDHRLRSLNAPESKLTKVELSRLNDKVIRNALASAGLGSLSLNEQQMRLLSTPFHLLLFLQGTPSADFYSVGDLYDQYWTRKRRNLKVRLDREAQWDTVVSALANRMSERQQLFAPIVTVDQWQEDAEAMCSEHVLIRVDNQYRFFHESFFDYAFARHFCARDSGLVEFLTTGEQHLFQRAQVRQVLAFRREHDLSQYLEDLRGILNSDSVRFHIRRMVASSLRQIAEPRGEEWQIVEPLLLGSNLSACLSPAIRDHPGWFDIMDQEGTLEKWLSSDDNSLIKAAIWCMASREVLDTRSERIAELLRPYLHAGEEWQEQILRVLSWGKAHKSEAMSAIFLEFVDRGAFDDAGSEAHWANLWHQLRDAETANPEFVIDVIARWFDRAIGDHDDGQSNDILRNCRLNKSQDGAVLVCEVAKTAPDCFIEQMLPRVTSVVLQTEIQSGERMRNRLWPWLNNHGVPLHVDHAILLALRRALEHVSRTNVDCLRQRAACIDEYPHETFSYLLLLAFAANPGVLADEGAAYIIADRRRLDVGYSGWMGDDQGTGECAITRTALEAISPHCSEPLLRQLETAILGFCDEYERENPERAGYTEHLLLRSLDGTRLSETARLRMEELAQRFAQAACGIVQEDMTTMASIVVSPIPPEETTQMTNDQWISAMQQHDGSDDPWKGGPAELSRLLSEEAGRNRQRFASLALLMPATLHTLYFSAILDGLTSRYASHQCEQEKEDDRRDLDSTPTELFVDVIDKLHSLPERPCGSAIVSAVRTLSARDLPEQILTTVLFYAMQDPDPAEDVWQMTSNGDSFFGGDPYAHGINTVRGQAALAVASLLFSDQARLSTLRPALASFASDPVISVRACGIHAFRPLLNFARDEAVNLFVTACGGCEDVWGTAPFDEFLHYSVLTLYSQLRELLQLALNSDNENAVENATRQILLADLCEVDVGNDAEQVRRGTETMRKVAAQVYSQNINNETVGSQCSARLQELFNDNAESVRKEVTHCFFHLAGERLRELEAFIGRFIESRSFEQGPDRLLGALEESNAALPHVVCRIAERVLECLANPSSPLSYREQMEFRGIATLVIRLYEQTTDAGTMTRCLDFIDQMEQEGFFGVGDELRKLDR